MFDHTSRYFSLPVHHTDDAEGRTLAYVGRRFLPQGDALPVLLNVTPKPGERLDQIAARTLGDSTLFWRVADANNAMRPAELTDTPGQALVVPTPLV
jgi:hypothetical protein